MQTRGRRRTSWACGRVWHAPGLFTSPSPPLPPNPEILRRRLAVPQRDLGRRSDELLEQRGIVPLAGLEIRERREEVLARRETLDAERAVGRRPRHADAARAGRPVLAVG